MGRNVHKEGLRNIMFVIDFVNNIFPRGSWNIMQTKWEKFWLAGLYFYIWFVFYASLHN